MKETFENRDMSGTVFRNVNLYRAVFDDVNLGEATIHNANLTGLSIDDAAIKGMTIYGLRVDQLISDELDRRDPERVRLRMADPYDPDSLRSVVGYLNKLRREFISKFCSTDPSLLVRRPDPDHWSAIEHVRHMVFAEDMYVNRWILRNDQPWTKLGLLSAFLQDNPKYSEVGSQPTDDLQEVLAAWEAIHTRALEFIAHVTTEELRRDTSDVDFGQGTVGNVLQGLAQHDLHHIREVEAAIITASSY